MAYFPVLRDRLSVSRPEEITEDTLRDAVANSVVEDDFLEWKVIPYPKAEMWKWAKVVASFANHQGGVVVVGVEEDADTGNPINLKPFSDSPDNLEQNIRRLCATNIEPIVAGLRMYAVAAAAGGHYLVMEIEPSRDAPHAQVSASEREVLRYPIREGRTTQYLRERDVARRYLERERGKAEIARDLRATHDAGVRRTPIGDLNWLAVSAVPVGKGAIPPGAAARLHATQFMGSWTVTPPPRNPPGHLIAFTSPPDTPRPALGSTLFSRADAHLELGHTGTAYVGQSLTTITPASVRTTLNGPNPTWAASDAIEWGIFVAIVLIQEWVRATNAFGEIEVVAQLVPAEAGSYPRAGVCALNPGPMAGKWVYTAEATNALLRPTETSPVTATLAAEDYGNRRAAAATAFVLATDILAEFGVDEPRVFAQDGAVDTDNLGSELITAGVPTWAEDNINTTI